MTRRGNIHYDIHIMNTVTVSKKEYETLKKKAALYGQVFQDVSKRMFGIEEYSDKRIREFMKEDRLDPKIRQRIERILSSS